MPCWVKRNMEIVLNIYISISNMNIAQNIFQNLGQHFLSEIQMKIS